MVKSDVAALTQDKMMGRAASKVVKAVVAQGTNLASRTSSDVITVGHNCTVASLKAKLADSWEPESQLATITNTSLFPLLSTFSQMYEKFRFDSLELVYEPSVSTMQAAGFIYIDCMENPDEVVYESEMSMSDSGAKRARPDKPLTYSIKCNKQWMYCQNGFVTGRNTLSDYALCKLVWATYGTGLTVGTALGKLKLKAKVSFTGLRMPASVTERIVGSYSCQMTGCSLPYASNDGLSWTVPATPTLCGTTSKVASFGVGSGISFANVIAGKIQITIPTFGLTAGATVFIDIKLASHTGVTVNFPAGFAADIGSGSTAYSGPIKFISTAGYPSSTGALCGGVTNPGDYSKFYQSAFCKNSTFSNCVTYSGESQAPMVLSLWLPVCIQYIDRNAADNVLYCSAQVVDYNGTDPVVEPS